MNTFERIMFANSMASNDDYQSDREVFRPLYEKERSKSGGIRRQAFGIVDKDTNERVNRGGEIRWGYDGHIKYRDYINGEFWRYRNRAYWYENLLKRVDETEKNLKANQSLGKYAEKRGHTKGMTSLFSGIAEGIGRPVQKNTESNELGILGGVGL